MADFHLQRAIFIDSYKSSAIAQVSLDDHTNLNGHNGAGKTALLRVLPLFYGEVPNRILRGESSKESLIGHYLSRSTSYIAFEYARRGQLCLAVMHSDSSGELVQYRFIGSGYSQDLFVDADGNLIQSGEILRHIAKREGQIECTRPLSRQDYAAILQNTTDKRDHRTLAARYSFVDSRHRLSNIEKIVTGMFERNTTFRDLRKMVVACIAEAEGKIEIGVKREVLETWCKDYEAYVRAMREETQYRRLAESDEERRRVLESLRQIKGWVEAYLAELKKQESEHRAEIARIDTSKRELRDGFENRSADVRADLAEAQESERATHRTIEQIDVRKNRYAAEQIEDKVKLVDALAANMASESEIGQEYEKLLGTSKSIAERYADLEGAEQQRCATQINKLTESKEPVRTTASGRRASAQSEYLAQLAQIREKAEDDKTGINEDLEKASHEIGRLTALIEQTTPDPVLSEQAVSKGKQVESARRELEERRVTLESARGAYERAREQFETVDREQRNARQRIDDLKDEIQKVIAVAEAGADSLLGFLRREKPDWVQDIARVVPREILLRCDLAPELAPSQGALFGVRIALDRIEPPMLADEQAIAEAIADLRGRIERADQRLQSADQALQQAAQEKDRCAQTRTEADSARISAESAYTVLLDEQKSLARQIEMSIRNKKKSAQESLDITKEQQASHRRELAAVDVALRESLQAAEKAHQEQERQIRDWEAAEIARINAAIGSLRSALEVRLLELRTERDRSLEQNGVDTATLSELQRRRGEMKEAISRGREAQNEVAQYRNWLQDVWARRDEHVVRHEKEKSKAREYQNAINALQREFNDRLSALMKQGDEQSKAIEKLDGEREALTQRLHSLADIEADPQAASADHDRAHTLAFISEQINKARRETKRLDEEIRAALDAVVRAFTGAPGTYTDNYYELCRKQFVPGTLRDEERQKIRALGEWFDGRHREPYGILHGQASLHGQAIHEFHDALRRFGDQARRFSNDLQTSIDGSVTFDLISSIRARLTFGVDELDYWRVIKTCSSEFELWAHSGKEELPGSEFVAAFRKVAESFRGEQGLSADLVDLVQLEIDLVENGRPVTVRNEQQLVHASSTGLSYLILIVIFIGFLSRIRREAPVQIVFAVDELKNLDLPNTECLFELLDRHHVTLISAFPDADPEVLRLFRHRYTIMPGRVLARVELDKEEDEDDPAAQTAEPAMSTAESENV